MVGLYNFLVKFFLSKDGSDLNVDELNHQEKEMLFLILKRKFLSKEKKFLNYLNSDLKEMVEICFQQKPKKRIEERKKFAFKHGLKYLKKKFSKSIESQHNTETKDDFYNHYFKKLS